MKSKKIYFLPLLALAPLLMANSPAPIVRANEYNDFSCSYLSREEVEDTNYNGRYLYNYKVTNNGTGCIESVLIQSTSIHGYIYAENDIFDDLVVLPGQTGILSLRTNNDVNPEGEELTYRGLAYQEFIQDAFINYDVEIEEKTSTYSSSPEYSYYVSFDTTVDIKKNDYEYGLIVELTYKGQKYAMHRDLDNSEEFYLCSTKEQLDLSQLTIDKLTMTKGPKYKSALGTFIVIVVVIFITFCALSVGGIIFAIVFPIARRAKRKRLENENK